MRKVLALFLAATLLCVSSVPMLVEAASCAMPEHAIEAVEVDGHQHHHTATVEQHAAHDHSATIAVDLQRDRIECGCGCHRSIDSLPHLLAPHMIDVAVEPEDDTDLAIENQHALPRFSAAPEVPLPPPDLS